MFDFRLRVNDQLGRDNSDELFRENVSILIAGYCVGRDAI